MKLCNWVWKWSLCKIVDGNLLLKNRYWVELYLSMKYWFLLLCKWFLGINSEVVILWVIRWNNGEYNV